MSKVRRFIDLVKDIGEVVVAAPIVATTGGAGLKIIGKSIAEPRVAQYVYKAGDILTKGGVKLAKLYAKATAAGAKSLATTLTPVAKSLPGSKYVPYLLKYGAIPATVYANVAMGRQLVKEFGKVKKLTGSPMSKLDSTRPQLNFQSVLKTFKDALLFK